MKKLKIISMIILGLVLMGCGRDVCGPRVKDNPGLYEVQAGDAAPVREDFQISSVNKPFQLSFIASDCSVVDENEQ